jgi:hypothetical protein
MLELIAKSKGLPIYQYPGGPTRFKVRMLAHPEGTDEAGMAAPLVRAKRRGFRAFSMALPPRESLAPLQLWVDRVRGRVSSTQGLKVDELVSANPGRVLGWLARVLYLKREGKGPWKFWRLFSRLTIMPHPVETRGVVEAISGRFRRGPDPRPVRRSCDRRGKRRRS